MFLVDYFHISASRLIRIEAISATTPETFFPKSEISMIQITDSIYISENDLAFSFSRASGPGGQNVNKVSTKVAVLLDLDACRAFSEDDRRRIRERLPNRVSGEGVLRVESGRHRSQAANREAAVERLVELIRFALARKPRRKKTKLPYAVKERRLDTKKRRSETKSARRRVSY